MPAHPMPVVTVLVAWANDPLDDPGLITDMVPADTVTADAWTVMTRCGSTPSMVSKLPKGSRGRQHELQAFEPASSSFRLDNAGGWFNPWNTASPYAGWLKPMRPVRVLAQWNLLTKAFSDADSTGTTWEEEGGLPVTRTALSPIHGSQSFAIAPTTGSAASVWFLRQPASHPWRRFVVDSRCTYSATLLARCSAPGPSMALVFRWYDAAGVLIGPVTYVMTALPTGAPATFSPTNGTPPAGACFGELRINIQSAPGITTTFDCVGVWPVGTPPAWAAGAEDPVRFTGHLHGFPISWPDRRSAWVDADASDMLRMLNVLELPPSVYDLEVQADNPLHLWTLSESAGATVCSDSGSSPAEATYRTVARLGFPPVVAGSNATSMGLPLTNFYGVILGDDLPPALDFTLETVVSGVTDASAPVLFGSRSAGGILLFQSLGGGPLFLQVTNDTGAVASVAGGSIDDGEAHHVVVTRSGGNNWQLIVDDVAVSLVTVGITRLRGAVGAGGSSSVMGGPGSMASIAVYSSVLSAPRITAHAAAAAGTAWAGDTADVRAERILDHLGLAAGARDLDPTCASALQAVAGLGGKALAYLQQLARAEAGALYVSRTGKVTLLSRLSIFGRAYDPVAVTFGDLPGQVPFQPSPDLSDGSDDITNVATASRTGGLTYRAVDQASVDDYGPRSRDITGLPLADDTEVVDRAHFEVAAYAEPAFTVRALTVWPREAAELVESILDLDLLDLVSVGRDDITGDPLSQDALLERLEETFTPTDWTVGVALSPVQAQQYWILGVSELGVNTRLAF